MLPPPSPVSAAPGLDVPDPSADPERCPPAFRLDRRDLALVRRQRRPANQLALALQIGCTSFSRNRLGETMVHLKRWYAELDADLAAYPIPISSRTASRTQWFKGADGARYLRTRGRQARATTSPADSVSGCSSVASTIRNLGTVHIGLSRA